MSPLLANIYLHELDEYMEEMRESFDHGVKRRANPAYVAHTYQIASLRKELDAIRESNTDKAKMRALRVQIKAIEKGRRTMPSVDPMDYQLPPAAILSIR